MNTAHETPMASASPRSDQSRGKLTRVEGQSAEVPEARQANLKGQSFSSVLESPPVTPRQQTEAQIGTESAGNYTRKDEAPSSSEKWDQGYGRDAPDPQEALASPDQGSTQDLQTIEERARNDVPDQLAGPEGSVHAAEQHARVSFVSRTGHRAGLDAVKTEEAAFPNPQPGDLPSTRDDVQKPTMPADNSKGPADANGAVLRRPAPPSISEMAVASQQNLVIVPEPNGNAENPIPVHGTTVALPFATKTQAGDHGTSLANTTELKIAPSLPRGERPERFSALLNTGDGRMKSDLAAGSDEGPSVVSMAPVTRSGSSALRPALPDAAPMITTLSTRKAAESADAGIVRGSAPPEQPFGSLIAQAGSATHTFPKSAAAAAGLSIPPAGRAELADATGLVPSEPIQDILWEPFRATGLSHIQSGISPRADQSAMVMRQIADVIPSATQRPVEIALSPEELGRVRISVTNDDRSITVQILAERPETLDLMRKHIDQLGNSFREMGYESISFAFGQGAQGNGPGTQDADDTASAGSGLNAQDDPTNAAVAMTLDTTGTHGLDLRL